jgi:hypothetical protein
MKTNWSESEASWNVARAGVPWAAAGAGALGSDYEATADAHDTVPVQAGWITFDVTGRLRSIAAGAPNLGWRIVGVSGTEGVRSLYASEYGTQALRPRLTVTYTAP